MAPVDPLRAPGLSGQTFDAGSPIELSVFVDAAGRIVHQGVDLPAAWDGPAATLVGQNIYDLLHPDDRPAVEAALRQPEPVLQRLSVRWRVPAPGEQWRHLAVTVHGWAPLAAGLARLCVARVEGAPPAGPAAPLDLDGSLQLDTVLDRLLEAVAGVVPHDASSLMLIEGDEASIVRCRGFAARGQEAEVLGWRLSLEASPKLQTMLQTRQPVIIPDTHASSGWVRLPASDWLHAYLGAPLCARGRVFGFLNLDSVQPDFFTPAQAERLQAVANQAAAAVENARLFEASARALQRERRLAEVGRIVSSSLDLPTVLRVVVRLAAEVMGAEAGALALVEDGALCLTAAYSYGWPDFPEAVRLPRQPALLWEVVETRQARVVPDYAGHPRAEPHAVAAGLREALLAPLMAGRQCAGVLVLAFTRPGWHFAERDVGLAESIGRQAGVAIQNARLFEEARQRADELAALYRSAAPLADSTNLERLAAQIATAVVEELDQTGCAVLLLDEPAAELRPVAARGLVSDTAHRPQRLYGPGSVALAARTGAEVYVPDVDADPRSLKRNTAARSELALPLRAGGGVIGVLTLESPRRAAYGDRERRVLSALAERAGLALQSARLFAQAEATNRHLAQLNTLTRLALEITRLPDLAQALADRLPAVLGADGVVLSLWEPAAGGGLTVTAGTLRAGLQAHFREGGASAVTGAVIAQRRTIVEPDPAGGERLSPGLAEALGLGAALGVPLLLGDQALGAVLHVFQQPRAFPPAAVAWAEQAANVAALALANSQLVERLEQARQTAEAANQLKSDFLANTSHELRTPLSGILGSLKIILDGLCDSPAEERTFLESAYSSSRRLMAQIDDLLDLAKIEAGQATVRAETFLLSALLAEVEPVARALAEPRQLALVFPQPPADERPVRADLERTRQILLNLLGNAVKFTEHGQVAVSVRQEPAQAVVAVRDTGLGIPPEAQARLFQPFVQVESGAARRYGGTGLGLSISRRLAELMGATLTLYSAGLGHGSTFTLALPLADRH